MSTLKVNKLRDTAGSTDAIVLDPNGGAVLAGVTTISTARITTGITTSIQVGGGVTISESGIEATGVGITCANINGGQISGRRNKVINGAMMVSQRNGDSAVQLSASEQYIVDRFKNDTGSSFNMKADASQSTDSPDGFSNSLKLACDGVSTPSGGDNGLIVTFIEGQDLQDLAFGTSNAKPLTLSFYAKSASQNNGHVYGVQLGAYLNGSRNSQTKGFTITSSWQRFVMTFDATGTVTSTPILNNNSFGMMVGFCLGVGPDDLVNYATWTADTGLKGFTGQDNFFDNTSNEIYITGVQLEVGSQATAFEHRSFGEELALCQRYFYVHSEGDSTSIGNGTYWTSNTVFCPVHFPVTMRVAPSLTVANDGSTNYYGWYRNGGANSEKGDNWIIGVAGVQGCEIYDPAASGTAGHSCFGRHTNANGKITFNSEL